MPDIPRDELEDALADARRSGRYLVAVFTQEADAVRVFHDHTPGVKLSLGLGALLKSVMPDLDKDAKRRFLEEMLKEWRS